MLFLLFPFVHHMTLIVPRRGWRTRESREIRVGADWQKRSETRPAADAAGCSPPVR
jgi:hypothetical protein